MQQPDLAIDCGASLGHGTNNSAELYALGICFTELRKLFLLHPHIKRAVIFSDSQLALKAAAAKSRPLTNSELTKRLRKAYAALLNTKRVVELYWIPGHCNVGGNERVDKIAKSFLCNGVIDNINSSPVFISHVSIMCGRSFL